MTKGEGQEGVESEDDADEDDADDRYGWYLDKLFDLLGLI